MGLIIADLVRVYQDAAATRLIISSIAATRLPGIAL